jgi:hypothetical protein
MATFNINVAISPKKTSAADGVTFALTAGAGAPSGVLASDGSIDLSKVYNAGTSVTLVFQLTTATIAFTSGPYVGSYVLNYYSTAQNGAKAAFLLGPKGGNPGVYSGTQFVFSPNAMGPNQQTLSVLDNNNDGQTYSYALVVVLLGTTQTFANDPRIVNHTQNK